MVDELLTEKIENLADSIGVDALGFAGALEFTDYATRNCLCRMPRQSLSPVSILGD
jgi:hypothetical protein